MRGEKLNAGDEVLTLHGDRTGLLFVEELPKHGSFRMVKLICRCGEFFSTRLTRVKQGVTRSCGCLRTRELKERRICKWQPGDRVGRFEILEFAGQDLNGRTSFKVFNHLNNKIVVMTQNDIYKWGTRPYERRLRGRVSTAVSRGYTERSDAYRILGASHERVLSHLGVKPGDDCQLDHICPLSQAESDEELKALNHYSNLQWISSKENAMKRNNLTDEGVKLCRKLLGREPRQLKKGE